MSDYLILDGTQTTNKETFLKEIGSLLKFPNYDEPDEQHIWDWDHLRNCLRDIVTIWENENPPFIEPISDASGALPEGFTITIIWLDPLDFSTYNSDDFYTALDILKDANYDKSTPLKFVLASNVSNIKISNTDI